MYDLPHYVKPKSKTSDVHATCPTNLKHTAAVSLVQCTGPTAQQLKAQVKEIENTRNQIQHSDLPQFDEQIKALQDEVKAGVNSFREVQQMYTHEKLNKEPKRMPFAKDRNSGAVGVKRTDSRLSALVHEQQEVIDSIENNIEHAQVNVEEGVNLLGVANKLKAVTYPVIGAAVGGLFGGPVGLAVGIKAGAAVAVGGGVLGFFGGKYVKKKNDDVTDIQLENLSSNKDKSQ
ncbi:syntaxin-17-like [Montipora capricornis]|uniref:syntaxin-17-like n=1 Tax=Montipora capricornis TaxID=246305 RepID=UPI0035F174EF